MSDPFYIRQTAEPMEPDKQRAWFQACADEAKAAGATWCRFSVHPQDARILLVEGWKHRPSHEGELRFGSIRGLRVRALRMS